MYYENFERLCKERNCKPSQVSRITGISTATLSSWKGGKYTPKMDKLRKIADFFGVDVGEIVNTNGLDFSPRAIEDRAFVNMVKDVIDYQYNGLSERELLLIELYRNNRDVRKRFDIYMDAYQDLNKKESD